jgi:glucose-1-phosphate adenylyltransferase
MNDVLTLILGGGRGARLFPLTHMRSKPAVPIGGKYRLIDIPISNCLHAGLKRMFVLTQFNSASLNRHIAQTYRLDVFSDGFVEILAAEQTPESSNWFQGTADAVRRAARHFAGYDADNYLILAGDHLYRMDFNDLIESHIEGSADITIAAQPVTPADATQMGIFLFDLDGQIVGFEEKPDTARLAEIGSSAPRGAVVGGTSAEKPFVASMGIYVFSRDVLHDVLARDNAVDFGREIIPHALSTHRVAAFFYRGFWADVGTVGSFYDVNMMLTKRSAAFNFFHPTRPIYTHPRFLPGSKMNNCNVHQSIIAEGCILTGADIKHSIIGIRTRIGGGTTIKNSILMGADTYETTRDLEENAAKRIPNIGIGNHCTVINAIIDKNVRIGDNVSIINAHNLQEKDDESYYIRDGIIVVPKGAWIRSGTVI